MTNSILMRPIRQYVALIFLAFSLLGLGLYASAFTRSVSSIAWQLHVIGAVSAALMVGSLLLWRGHTLGRYVLGLSVIASLVFWCYEFVLFRFDDFGSYRTYESVLVLCFLLGTHTALILLLRHRALYEHARQLPTRPDVLDM